MSTSVTIVNDAINVSLATVGPSGPTGPAGPAGPPNLSPILQGTVFISAATNATVVLLSYACYSFTLVQLNNLQINSGAITLTINRNGIAIPGLTNIAVTGTPQFPVATSNNVFSVGDNITLVLSGGTLATNLQFTAQFSVP